MFLAPLRLYGGGTYTLSDVKEIDGTKEFIKLAEKAGQCQNKETKENCQTRKYLTQGMETCSCTPYKLRNFTKMVSTYFLIGAVFLKRNIIHNL